MRQRLTAATIASLIEDGYARTTALAVCARAGVTRGAFHHHFPSLAALYVAALEQLYAELSSGVPAPVARQGPAAARRRVVQRIVAATRRPEFKAVIEIWIAARNDASLRRELSPAIAQLGRLFEPENPAIAQRIGRSRRAAAFYRLTMEAAIGMALGRAVSPGNRPLAHEDLVVDLLLELADRA